VAYYTSINQYLYRDILEECKEKCPLHTVDVEVGVGREVCGACITSFCVYDFYFK
jgi:hypothetical protein